jgi:manganese/iron transport system permease protein
MGGLEGWLFEPYGFEFMRRGLLALVLVSLVGGVVGAFVVNKGLAFSGDALAHSTLAGVAVAFVLGGSVLLGGLLAAVITALGVGLTRRRARVSYDTAIGIFFVSMFSFGILVLSRRTSYTPDLTAFVFGNILGVSSSDLLAAGVLSAALLLFVFAFYRELQLVAYDPAVAAAMGVRATLFEYAILVMVAIAVVVALKAIGIVLVNAMLIIPAATAGLLVRRLPQIMVYASLLGVASAVVGLHLSFHARVAASPAVVLTAAAVFLVVAVFTSRRRARVPGSEAPA